MLIRIVSMLTKPGQRNHEVRESPGRYDHLDYDNDNDNDNDADNGQWRQRWALMDLFSLLVNRSNGPQDPSQCFDRLAELEDGDDLQPCDTALGDIAGRHDRPTHAMLDRLAETVRPIRHRADLAG